MHRVSICVPLYCSALCMLVCLCVCLYVCLSICTCLLYRYLRVSLCLSVSVSLWLCFCMQWTYQLVWTVCTHLPACVLSIHLHFHQSRWSALTVCSRSLSTSLSRGFSPVALQLRMLEVFSSDEAFKGPDPQQSRRDAAVVTLFLIRNG